MTATPAPAPSATAVPRARTRTGGPKDTGPRLLEHLLGWTLVVVIAMFVTQTGLL
ncbi:SCO1431 family membrane protein [Actinomycetota bacterium Odt1-20B]